MIDKREVVVLKIPYPDIYSGLAKKLHMYICVKKVHSVKRLVKCQSMKLSNIIGGAGISNYIIETPDINRNPFSHPTLIDCDKLFIVDLIIPRSLLAKPRPDVSLDLYNDILKKLTVSLPSKHKLPREGIVALNSAIKNT